METITEKIRGVYEFYKTLSNQWYVDLPDWPGDKGELEMVAGADDMLNMIADGQEKIKLEISNEPFENADQLTFVSFELQFGGGYYNLRQFEGRITGSPEKGHDMWLCGVTNFVFKGELPKIIYIKRA